ncbi:MAG: CoA pyrophosphatase [Pseudomonadota bacterium]
MTEEHLARIQIGDDCYFTDSLAEHIRRILSGFKINRENRQGLKHAAIAFTLVRCSAPANIGNIAHTPAHLKQAGFVLTTRAAKLSSHPGQRAFPGGRVDPGETVEQAALRELSEEVDLQIEPSAILGRLDDFRTRSGFVISPVVVWVDEQLEMTANPGEVEIIHRIPLNELLRDDAPILEAGAASGSPVLKMPLGDDWFAAPSAAIAYQFREVALLGRDTRVAHFEQPEFAWQ